MCTLHDHSQARLTHDTMFLLERSREIIINAEEILIGMMQAVRIFCSTRRTGGIEQKKKRFFFKCVKMKHMAFQTVLSARR